MKKSIISTKELCKSYAHNGIQNHILKQIEVDIYEGDFTVIMGPSGSGKSTLLYSLSGMDKPNSGEIWYADKDITKYNEDQLATLRKNAFGFVFQQIHLVSNLSLFENVAVCGYLNKKNPSKEVNKRVESLLEQVGLNTLMNRLPSQVSGGEQQRAAIIRAVINNPELLFADEPTGALNKANSIEVLNLLSKLNKDGQSILMVTHDTRAALRANRVLYLEDGRITGELTLPPYQMEEKSRETQLNSWLSSLEW